MEPMIDPALLEEEAKGAEDNDLEDAEGELMDEMTEEQYASYGGYNANDPSADQIMEPQAMYNEEYQPFYEYPGDSNVYASDHIDAVMPDAGPSRPRGHRSESRASYSHDDDTVAAPVPITPKRRGRPPKNLQLLRQAQNPDTTNDPLLPRPKKGRPRTKMPERKGGRDSLEEGEYNPGPPDTLCSFCYGPNERNRAGEPEKMVTCVWCKRSGHPSCLSMFTPRIISAVFSYDWYCQVCKTCEVCKQKGRESNLMFCDGCDRGWHTYCLNPPLVKPPKGKWLCPICHPTNKSATPQPPSSLAKIKGRDAHHAIHPTFSTDVTPVIKRPRGRPRKNPLVETPRYNDKDHFQHGSARTVKSQSSRRGRKPKHSSTFSDTDDDTPPPTGVRIRLRLSGGARKRTVEVESEEEKVPYGGVITGEDADTSKTTITERDKEAFEKARQVAEAKLGGPPPVDDTPVGNESPAPSSNGYFPSPGPTPPAQTPSLQRGLRDRLLQSSVNMGTPGNSMALTKTAGGAGTGVAEKIKTIRFGVYDIDTWYSAPYPEEYQHVPEGRLWLCEFCLKYMKSGFVSERHRMKCKARHPPGDEIYRKDNVSVFEVDGRKNKIYCQNLCLLAKMFLDHKTLYYDVEPFLFYVMTEVDDLGARFVGYFSKEKRSPDNNVSCIMTLPVRQRKGWGQLLIDFSYLLSKKEERVGGPERPLSGLGEVTYKKYWQLAVFRFLRNSPGDPTLEDICRATSLTISDVYQTLKDQDMIEEHDTPAPDPHPMNGHSTPSFHRRRGRGRGGRLGSARRPVQPRSATPEKAEEEKIIIPERYTIRWDRDYVEAVLKKHDSRGYLELAPERLKYHPFLVTRNPTKPPGALAQATLAAGTSATTQTAVDLTEPNDDELAEAQDAPEGDDALQETVQHGEDRATLDLVAALAHEPAHRSLRKRTSSELNTPGPASLKKLRSSERVKSPSLSPARPTTRTRSNGDHHLGQTPNGSARSMQRAASGRALRTMSRDYENGTDSDGSDDPLRLGKGLNGTPKRSGRSSGANFGTPTRRSGLGGTTRGGASSKAVTTEVVDEDTDAEGEDEEDEGDIDADADGEWEGDTEADAEGEDDEEYEE